MGKLNPRGLWSAAAALVILNVFVYGAVTGFSFVDFDDPTYVTENAQVSAGLSWTGLAWAFTSTIGGNWHPLTMLSHMLDANLYGMWAGGHHLTNLLLHTASSLILFLLINRMAGAIGRSLFVAALFAAHPLHVESVAWIAERKDVLSTFLAFVTIWMYVSYVRTPSWSKYLGVVLGFALALLAKPMVVTLPFLLLLLDIWPLERITARDAGWKAWRPLLQEKLVLFLLAFAASVITYNVQEVTGAVASFDRLPAGVRVGNALISYWTYIWQTVWPVGLAAYYPYQEGAVTLLRAGAAGVALAAVSVFVVKASRVRPFVFTGWFWFVGLLVPVIGFIQVGNQATADRYTYVPIVGLFLIAAWAIPEAVSRWPRARVALPVAASIVIIVCAVIARTQAATWRNSRSLWTHALEVMPDNYFAHGSLGAILVNAGEVDAGTAHLNESMKQRQRLAEEENKVGDALAREGRLDEAAARYAQAVRINPRFAEAHVNLGLVLARLGRTVEAIPELKEGLRLKPKQPEVYCNLAVLYQQQGNSAEARRQLEAALTVAPGHPRATRMLADIR